VTADGATPDGREQGLTDRVLASFEHSGSARYREVMQALVRHLHAFAREVRLTDDEWAQGIDFLTRTGRATTETRQEFVLLSDVLGVSMLTVGINAPEHPDATPGTVFGPFFVADAPHVPLGGDVGAGAVGRACFVSGTVRDTDGRPLAGARIEVWEADDEGLYDVQRPDGPVTGRGWLQTDDGGGYRFWAVRPAPYPIPVDGPVGDLLAAADRGPMRPAHLHLRVTAPGCRTLVTHVFVAGDPYLEQDAVFGVIPSLVATWDDHPPGPGPEGRVLDEPWSSLDFDLVLARLPEQPD
jgi:hydroxyquinol 1,2-dioxygenase